MLKKSKIIVYLLLIQAPIKIFTATNEAINKLKAGVSLADADLSNENLSNADLSNRNLSNADLSNVDLTGAILTEANLSKAKLINTKLVNTNLIGADFSNADLTGADLNKATIGITNKKFIKGKTIQKNVATNFTRADLRQVKNLSKIIVTGEKSTLSSIVKQELHPIFKEAKLSNQNFENFLYPKNYWEVLPSGRVSASHNREDSNVEYGMNFESAILSRSNFIRSGLNEINFQNAKLDNINFSFSQISNSNLQNADLTETRFISAFLDKSNFKNATLTGTDFRGMENKPTYLAECNFSNTDLSKAKFNKYTLNENSNFQGATMTKIAYDILKPKGNLGIFFSNIKIV